MYFRRLLTILIIAWSGGCVSVSAVDLRQYLDESTAVVVTGLSKPMLLQRDRPQLGVNAKDQIHAGPIEINRSGHYAYYLWLGIWSTVDNPTAQSHRDGFKTIYLLVDGEPMELQLTAWNFDRSGGLFELYEKPVGAASDAVYAVTVDQLARVAGADRVQLATNTVTDKAYDIEDWNPGAMASFVAYVRGEN